MFMSPDLGAAHFKLWLNSARFQGNKTNNSGSDRSKDPICDVEY